MTFVPRSCFDVFTFDFNTCVASEDGHFLEYLQQVDSKLILAKEILVKLQFLVDMVYSTLISILTGELQYKEGVSY